MAVQLQTAEGKIKEYQTVYGVGSVIGGEVSGVNKWISKCGREWDKMPEPHQECSHLECAICAAEDWKFNLIFGFPFFGAIAAIFFHFRDLEGLRGLFTLVSLAFAIGAIILLVWGLAGKNSWDELNEFKNNGTVKGITAWQIHEDPNTRLILLAGEFKKTVEKMPDLPETALPGPHAPGADRPPASDRGHGKDSNALLPLQEEAKKKGWWRFWK